MLRTYIKIALRNLWKSKGVSAINISGLAIGIATCLVILLFVQNELSFDAFHEKAGRIVRVNFQGKMEGETFNELSVMPPVAQTLKADFPEVEEATRVRNFGTPRLVYEDKSFREDALAFVDSNFFQVFTLPLIQGSSRTALLEPNTAVVTRALAEKYFGKQEPLGKLIRFKDGSHAPLKVTGVIEKIPVNSHFRYEIFASMASLPEARELSWMTSNFNTYLVLAKDFDYRKLEAKLPTVVEKYIGPQMFAAMHITLADFRKQGKNISFHLQPLSELHVSSNFPAELTEGDIRYVYIFGAIALFMLVIACINFMNLSTAGASKRAREVGVRKVLGSLKAELVKQFLVESVLITAIALLFATGLVYLSLPVFNSLTSQHLVFHFSDHPYVVPGLLFFVLAVGILAGSYPAFYLSSFNPAAVLKGKFTHGKKSIGLRSGLVVFQFFVSITLIIGTAVVYKQLSFIQHKKLGYDKEQVLVLPDTWMLGNNREVFRQELLADSRVLAISNSGYLPAGPTDNNNFFINTRDNNQVKTLRYDVDEKYISVLGIELLTGRNFSKAYAGSDSSGAIINETAARALHLQGDPLGQVFYNNDNRGATRAYHVIGVVKDFHFKSLHEQIAPLVMVLAPSAGTMIVKLKTKNVASLLSTLNRRWTELGASEAFTYSFLDDRFNAMYSAEQKIAYILAIFAGLTIFVACLGLFGLAKFTAEQRTKEIGIRKVLGASASRVALLLSKDFLRLVVIAFVIASPIAWFIMDRWLQDFAYRISINIWVFAWTALLAVIITLITVSFQAIKAAIVNPVDSLRTE